MSALNVYHFHGRLKGEGRGEGRGEDRGRTGEGKGKERGRKGNGGGERKEGGKDKEGKGEELGENDKRLKGESKFEPIFQYQLVLLLVHSHITPSPMFFLIPNLPSLLT